MFTKKEYFAFIDKTFADMRALIEKKNNDYTAGNQETDPFRNFREATEFGIDPLAGLANRMNDKFNRIKACFKTGDLAVKTEGVEDAFKDMIGYSLLALGMLTEAKRIGDPCQMHPPLPPCARSTDEALENIIHTQSKDDDAIGHYLLGPDEIVEEGDEWQEAGDGDYWFACGGLFTNGVGKRVGTLARFGGLWDDPENSSGVKVRRIVKGGAE